uniref:MFS domain-containing protein n=1 Tax=Caenorhabditis japonica TaxID=281687 RepID=A0A8R1HJV7_CAEJA
MTGAIRPIEEQIIHTTEMPAARILKEKQTDWKSMWICIFLQFIVGVQISVYYMSMWPYLSGLDKTADVDFLGWVVAACSIGCTISNPIYGYWNQKTMSVKWPVITGFLIAGVGQVWYGLLSVSSNVKWYMLVARLLTGLGVGNIAALRVYAATASTSKDRMRAISFGTGGFVLGISFGPVTSAVFTPLGDGFRIGFLVFNMYTVVAYLMALICLLVCAVIYFFFEESYVGIVTKEEKEQDELVVSKFDGPAAIICIYLFMIVNIIATNVEVMSTPLTTVLYEWKDSDSILYNGITLALSCVISVLLNVAQGTTRIGKIDKRNQMLIGIFVFLLYQLFMYPWAFYSGPLNFLPDGLDTTEAGGCYKEYLWCSETTRVPLSVYLFCFIVFFGVAFPFVETPSAALYSEVLGPRKQGTMQGFFSLGGSIAPVIAAISSTSMFKHTGYRYVILLQTVILLAGAAFILIFYKRLVPCKVVKKSGDAESRQN